MKWPIFDLEPCVKNVCRLLQEVGLIIRNEKVKSHMLQKGCQAGPDGRIRIPQELIHEFIRAREADQRVNRGKKRLKAEPPNQPGFLPMSVFGCGPTKYHDYETGRELRVTTSIFTDMIKLADAIPDIGSTSSWFRNDCPAPIEVVESTVMAYTLSDKTRANDCLWPGQVKFMQEISSIITGQPISRFINICQCMSPPMILGERAAGEMVELVECGTPVFSVATMVTIGINTPLNLINAAILGAAEIIGGLIAGYALEMNATFAGEAATTMCDMKSGNTVMNCPETIQCDVLIKRIVETGFATDARAWVHYAPNAKVPGLHAVYENVLAGYGAALLLNAPMRYPGEGILAVGAIGSPVQTMLDLEVARSCNCLYQGGISATDQLEIEELSRIIRGEETYLTHEHTIQHCRAPWSPELFWRGAADQSEKAILDRCNAKWKEYLRQYQPPKRDEHILSELNKVVERARRELLSAKPY